MFIEETEETKGFRIEIGHPFLVDPRSYDLSIDLLLKEKVDKCFDSNQVRYSDTYYLDLSTCPINVHASCFYRFLLEILRIILYSMQRENNY